MLNSETPHPAETLPAAPRPAALDVFTSWSRQQVNTVQAMDEESVKVYRSMWASWLRYLAGPQVERTWYSARPSDVDGFLETLARRRGDTQQASHVSRRRYWSVLSRIYEHARKRAWCRSNPTHKAREVPRSEECLAVVLPPAYLDRLRALAGECVADQPWLATRDRAMLAVLLDGALTTSELVALGVHQVLAYTPMEIKVLRIDGDRPAQRRDVPLEPGSSTLLQVWLDQRAQLMGERARGGPVFISRKGWAPVTPKTIHHVLQGFVSQLEREFGTTIEHRGANLVRSSVIAHWLNLGMSVSDVLARAGLEDTPALRRLAHAAPRRERQTDSNH